MGVGWVWFRDILWGRSKSQLFTWHVCGRSAVCTADSRWISLWTLSTRCSRSSRGAVLVCRVWLGGRAFAVLWAVVATIHPPRIVPDVSTTETATSLPDHTQVGHGSITQFTVRLCVVTGINFHPKKFPVKNSVAGIDSVDTHEYLWKGVRIYLIVLYMLSMMWDTVCWQGIIRRHSVIMPLHQSLDSMENLGGSGLKCQKWIVFIAWYWYLEYRPAMFIGCLGGAAVRRRTRDRKVAGLGLGGARSLVSGGG